MNQKFLRHNKSQQQNECDINKYRCEINYVDEELEVNNELEEDDIYFQNLYNERKKKELDTQLKDIRNEKHNIYNKYFMIILYF